MNFLGRQFLKIIQDEIRSQSNVCAVRRLFSYKSAFSLENLYPKSNMRLYTPNFVPEDPNAKFNGFIPLDKIKVTYSCSSGPGGQNVNRVNTKVDLRFHLKEATWLDEEIREKLSEQCKNNINKEGYLIIKSELTRSQQLNLADALEKLRNLIRKTMVEPRERSSVFWERIRKLQVQAAQRRVFAKRMRSQTRQDRRGADV
ncbi:peptidyl-tRNA hydrolase ICT1, mitochondrial isoform X1 [Belonocnema kinseyi]|uniref:peptidyl-tRNA hydrolase ICT1, mitochondrial isoform X1 n=2 Tax=Belonocnema kinseyi TaxID=2817044 RepID=UPI00143D0BEE|nr:peptidyl-tRNA hydrolase ICT1, mitochondrial isoform X1 [Belonocnema kinseyi]